MRGLTGVLAVASNIVDGENPPYTVDDFRSAMPGFTEEIISNEVLGTFVDMAHSIVKEARWHKLWPEGMRLFIAHFVTLYLSTPQAGATVDELISAGKVQGAVTSKQVGSISVSLDVSQATNDLTGWAAWKLTTYGIQFVTFARLIGKGGMYVY